MFRNVKTHCRIRIVDGEVETETKVEIVGNMSARIYSNLDINISKRVVTLLNDTFRENFKKTVQENVHDRLKKMHRNDMSNCSNSNVTDKIVFKHMYFDKDGLKFSVNVEDVPKLDQEDALVLPQSYFAKELANS